MKKQKYLVLIVGPTAVGKTSLCLELAKALNSDIFSCDSRQFYQELAIGTAKPSKFELEQVKHHFIDNLSITETYTVSDYEHDFMNTLESYFKTKDVALATGGSGLFAKAISHGFDSIPEIPKTIRASIQVKLENEGLESLQNELLRLDHAHYEEIDLNNKHRLIRALEIINYTKIPYSIWRKNKSAKRPFKIIKIGLERDRPELYNRINARVDEMLKAGLIEEVKGLLNHRNKNALQTVGYKEVFNFLAHEYNEERMTELIKRNTRRYAKRQLTWFKNQDNFTWFHPKEYKQIHQYILKEMAQ